MTKLQPVSSVDDASKASDAPIDEGDSTPRATSEPPLQLVLAPKRSQERWRFARIGASVAVALIIGYLLGSITGLKHVLGLRVGQEHADLMQALPPKTTVATGATDKQEIARLVNEIDSLRAQIERVRDSADNLHASERLRALEAAREQSGKAGETNSAVMARLDKLEARLAQFEHTKFDRTPTSVFSRPEPGAIAKPNDKPAMNTRARDQKSAGDPKAIADYALDSVDRGHAFVKRPDGFLEEVAPGDELPGAGRVTTIERRNNGWIVRTTQGIIIPRP
jgi:hypothetical protein